MAETPHIVTVTEENFAFAVLEQSAEVPVLVDFWADWCAPCRMLSPILDKLAAELKGKLVVAKVNSDQQQQLAMQYGVRSLPTVKLFRDGRIVDEFMGALPEGQIRSFLDRHMPRESDALVARAQTLIEQGDVDAAGRLLDQAQADDPGNPRVSLALAAFKLSRGAFDEAAAAVEALPFEMQELEEVLEIKARLLLASSVGSLPPRPQLQAALEAEPSNAEARHGLAQHQAMQGDYDSALENLLLVIQQSSEHRDAARETMLALFNLIGDDERVTRFRRRMFNALH